MNKSTHKEGERGFIKTVILIVAALLAVKYVFHFDIVVWYNSPNGQKYVQPVWNIIKSFYSWADNTVRKYI
jgi:hypothetical protein